MVAHSSVLFDHDIFLQVLGVKRLLGTTLGTFRSTLNLQGTVSPYPQSTKAAAESFFSLQ